MSHLFLIFGSFYLVITNIGVILHYNLKTKDMKKILLMLPIFIMFSCESNKEVEYNVIYYKSNTDFWNNQIENDFCRFLYYRKGHEYPIEFRDKCEKYNIGDSIK